MLLARAMTALTLKLAGPSGSMSDLARDLEPLFARYVEEHVLHGRVLAAEELCGPRVELIAPLDRLIARYQSITSLLDTDSTPGSTAD